MGVALKYILATLLAFMPALIWIDIFKHHIPKKQKWVSGWLFLAGMLSALPILALLYGWFWLIGADLYAQVSGSVNNVLLGTAIATMLAGFLEEVAKNSVVRYSDKFNYPVKSANEAVKFSIFAALGFAFTENIIYFANSIGVDSLANTFVIVVFRSAFTICAHLVFSGILGYYFSIAKFASPFVEQEAWQGKKYFLVEFLNKYLKVKKAAAYRKIKMLTGVLIAASLHATFNLLLQKQQLENATILVVLGFIYVYYLMTRRGGQLNLAYKKQRKSQMQNQDEDVVIELLGMWLNEGKYAEVESICHRLLKKDPDNKVVKIFLAKAHDRKKLINAWLAIKALFTPEDPEQIINILDAKKTGNQTGENPSLTAQDFKKRKSKSNARKTF